MGCLNLEACYRSIVFIDPLCAAALVILSHRHGCYISVMRRCGALVTRVDRRGVTTVFAPVFCGTSAGQVSSAGCGLLLWGFGLQLAGVLLGQQMVVLLLALRVMTVQ